MRNPLYEIEQKRLYLNRIITTDSSVAITELQKLIDTKIVDYNDLNGMSIREVQINYLIQIADSFEVYRILKNIKPLSNNN